MWRAQLNHGEEWLIQNDQDLNKFMNANKNEYVSIKFIEIWQAKELKEPLTKREKAEQPKEPIPLSRFEENDE